MTSSARGDGIQELMALLKKAGADLPAEDWADLLWLAVQGAAVSSVAVQPDRSRSQTAVSNRQEERQPRRTDDRGPKTSVTHTPPPTRTAGGRLLSGTLPIQVSAAKALRAQRELARALRPLMRKIPSPTQRSFDEEQTAIQTAEQRVLCPVLQATPERWLDLAIVVEASASLNLWEATIAELQAVVEQQGAFRQIRTWRLLTPELQLVPNWQRSGIRSGTTPRAQPSKVLHDPTQRRVIWVVSDCTSSLWDQPPIYRLLQEWGRRLPVALVQLLPERLWERTGLGVGQLVRLTGSTPGQPMTKLKVQPVTPLLGMDGGDEAGEREAVGEGLLRDERVGMPVVSLEPEPLQRWARVTAGLPTVGVAGISLALSRLGAEEGDALAGDRSPVEQVQEFCRTASPLAQQLAGLMAAVPVSLPVVNLLQQTLLPASRQVHVAEVFMSGLIEGVSVANVPAANPELEIPALEQYDFVAGVREPLIDRVPISQTVKVLDAVSAHVAGRLGLGVKSFTALIALQPRLNEAQQVAVRPFAEIALSTLKRLGGDYRRLAAQLEAQIVSPPLPLGGDRLPPLQRHDFRIAYVEVEPLERFEFESATLQKRAGRRAKPEWVITRSRGYGWQRVEPLVFEQLATAVTSSQPAVTVPLAMVEILGGPFLMGSPPDEIDRFSDEGPQHEVTVGDFFISKTPITQAQWRVVAQLPRVRRDLNPDPSDFKGDNRPVEQVSWYDADEFCARLSQATGRDYRLPTEAEWEYACRAGTTTPFAFGETITTDLANYDGGYTYGEGPKGEDRNQTTEVGRFPANAWGLYDMHGNVWEWCLDHWHDNYEGKPEALKRNGNIPWLYDDIVIEGENKEEEERGRSLRGGSWIYPPRNCRSAYRGHARPGYGSLNYGFRVVLGSLPRTL